MKLLIAVPSRYHSRKIFNETMRWLPRTGFNYRVFVPQGQGKSYKRRIKNANYYGYLDIEEDYVVEVPLNQSEDDQIDAFINVYADMNGFQLVFVLRDNISTFKVDDALLDDNELVVKFHSLILNARVDIENKYKGDEVLLMELPV